MPPETRDAKDAKAAARAAEEAAPPPPPAPPPRNLVRSLINAAVATVLLAALGAGGWFAWHVLDDADARARRSGPTIDLPDIRAVKWVNDKNFYAIRVSPTIELDGGRSTADLADIQLLVAARNAEIRDRIGTKISELPELEIKSNGFNQLIKGIVKSQINDEVIKAPVVTNVWIKDAPVIEFGSP